MTDIEPVEPSHFGAIAQWLARPEINQWLTEDWRDRPVTTALVASAIRNRRNMLFAVRHEGRLCGLTALADIQRVDMTAMAWYALGERDAGGRGVMTMAVRRMVDHCFGQLGLKSVYAWAMAENTPSIRLLERAGFRRAGTIRAAANCMSRQMDRVYFDVVANEWAAMAAHTSLPELP